MSHDPSGSLGSTPDAESSTAARSHDSHVSDAARSSPGRIRRDPRHARAGAGLALSPPLLPGRSRPPRLDLHRTPATGPRSTSGTSCSAKSPGAPDQIQCFAVPGHKADFGIVMAGPDLRAIHDIQMAIQASSLGPALHPTLFVLLDHRGLRIRAR